MTSCGVSGGERLGVCFILLMVQCCQHICTCGCLPLGLCSNRSAIVVQVLNGSDVLVSFPYKQCRCVVWTVPTCYINHKGVEVDCKYVGDCAEELVMGALHISLLGQCLFVHSVFLMAPLGRRIMRTPTAKHAQQAWCTEQSALRGVGSPCQSQPHCILPRHRWQHNAHAWGRVAQGCTEGVQASVVDPRGCLRRKTNEPATSQ
jgi:hypothetical protein